MPRIARVPGQLTRSPFTLAEARAAGLTPRALRSRSIRRIGCGLYCWLHWPEEKWALLSAWQRLLPEAATFSGPTAASIHGLDFAYANPVQVMLPKESSVRTQYGLIVRHCEVRSDDIVTVNGLRATCLERTLRDLCVQWTAEEALVAFDNAVQLKLADAEGLWRSACEAAGEPGAGRMGQLAQIAEPAESPMETRLRWLLLRAGIPRPQVQSDLYDNAGRFVGRADLYFPNARLILEFDGGNHRERLISDDRRQNELVNAGFNVLRFTTADIRGRPQVVVAQVHAALAAASKSSLFVQKRRIPRRRAARFVQKGPFEGAV